MSEEETKICPKCGMEVSADEIFCPICGCEVPEIQEDKKVKIVFNSEDLRCEVPVQEGKKDDVCDNTKFSVSQDTASENNAKEENAGQNTSGTKVCPQCGNECKNDDLFCNKCGCNLKQDKKCPNCGTPYADGTAFCGECGTKLTTAAATVTTNANAQYQENTSQPNYNQDSGIKCKYCGSQINRGVKKCPHCGEWLEGGYSGCGCGCSGLIVILCIIGAIFMAYIGESINLPFVGELAGGYIVIITIGYFLPSLFAEARNSENSFWVFLLTLLLGWTGIGWFLALIFAFTGRRRH